MEELKENSNQNKQDSDSYFIVDAHTHLLDYTEKQLEQILQNAQKSNVKHIMTNCCVESDFSKMQNIMKNVKDNFIINSYGLHPWWLNDRTPNWLDNLRTYLENNPDSHLGEIGLDQLKYERTPKEEQIEIFEQQMKLGIQYDRIVSVHCVRAQPEMLKSLKKFFINPTEKKMNIIMHSYGGNKEMTKGYLKLHANIYFSLSQGIIKRPEVAQVIPIEKLLVESDGPHQLCEKEIIDSGLFTEEDFIINENPLLISSIPKLNEPKYCHVMVDFLAKLHNKTKQEMGNILFQNSLRALRLVK